MNNNLYFINPGIMYIYMYYTQLNKLYQQILIIKIECLIKAFVIFTLDYYQFFGLLPI